MVPGIKPIPNPQRSARAPSLGRLTFNVGFVDVNGFANGFGFGSDLDIVEFGTGSSVS